MDLKDWHVSSKGRNGVTFVRGTVNGDTRWCGTRVGVGRHGHVGVTLCLWSRLSSSRDRMSISQHVGMSNMYLGVVVRCLYRWNELLFGDQVEVWDFLKESVSGHHHWTQDDPNWLIVGMFCQTHGGQWQKPRGPLVTQNSFSHESVPQKRPEASEKLSIQYLTRGGALGRVQNLRRQYCWVTQVNLISYSL